MKNALMNDVGTFKHNIKQILHSRLLCLLMMTVCARCFLMCVFYFVCVPVYRKRSNKIMSAVPCMV